MSQFSVTGGQAVEFVTSSPHGLPDQAPVSLGTGWPTLTFTDSLTWNPSGISTDNTYTFGAFITGPNTFAAIYGRSSGSQVTLSEATGTESITATWQPGGSNGYPVEFTAIVTGSFPGASLQVSIPLMATDAYVWDVATKVKNYFPAGRRVYVELSDEPWNYWPLGAYYTGGFISLVAGQGFNSYYYMVLRTGAIRTIFRSVFGDRENEIHAILNMREGGFPTAWSVPTSGNMGGPLGVAAYYGVPIDACAVANYINPDSSASTIGAWNNSTTIQQLLDLYIHDIWYNPYGLSAQATSYGALIAGYNAYAGSNCVYYGYEGDVSGPPSGVNDANSLMIDICDDPLWVIGEQDFYGFLQKWGYANSNAYSWNLYFYHPENWAYFHSLTQPYGKGDGSLASNGIAYTNRNYFITARFRIDYAGTPATNVIANTASVRGQALVGWMQPAQGKKRMLFVPYRFVNR